MTPNQTRQGASRIGETLEAAQLHFSLLTTRSVRRLPFRVVLSFVVGRCRTRNNIRTLPLFILEIDHFFPIEQLAAAHYQHAESEWIFILLGCRRRRRFRGLIFFLSRATNLKTPPQGSDQNGPRKQIRRICTKRNNNSNDSDQKCVSRNELFLCDDLLCKIDKSRSSCFLFFFSCCRSIHGKHRTKLLGADRKDLRNSVVCCDTSS